MAVISVNLTDTFEQWRTKTNTLCIQQGDLTTLTTTAKNTMVAAINEIDASVQGISNVVEDASPQLGHNLDVLTRSIFTSVTNGNIVITPDGSGKVVLDGISWPNALGSNGQVLQTDGSGVLSFATISSDPTMGGDLSGPASNAQLVANSVTTTELAVGAVANTNIADNVISTGKILNGTLLNDDISNSAGITGGKLANNTITATQLAANVITDAEVADNALSGNKIHGGTISNFASTGIDDNADALAMTIDSSERVGIGIASPDGRLHIHNGSAGSIAANGGADELVVENSSTCGMSFLSPSNTEQFIIFADPDDDNVGEIVYNHVYNTLRFQTNASERMRIDSSGNLLMGQTSHTRGILDIKMADSTNTSDYQHRTGIRLVSYCGTVNEIGPSIELTTSGNAEFLMGLQNASQAGTQNADLFFRIKDNTSDTGMEEFMRVKPNQNVGIGNSNPSEKLYVGGNIYATGNITAYSDERIKTNIKELDNTLNAIQNIRGVSYTRTDTKDNSIGVMAQDVETMFPELICEDHSGMKSVNYNGLVGVLFSAVKELSATVKQLKERNN